MLDNPEPENPVKTAPFAAAFRAMGDKIDLNSADFAGAMVIIGPNGKKIETLSLSATPNEAAFWVQVKGLVDIAINELSQEEQARSPFGQVRR